MQREEEYFLSFCVVDNRAVIQFIPLPVDHFGGSLGPLTNRNASLTTSSVEVLLEFDPSWRRETDYDVILSLIGLVGGPSDPSK